jgi:hypothetical protein
MRARRFVVLVFAGLALGAPGCGGGGNGPPGPGDPDAEITDNTPDIPGEVGTWTWLPVPGTQCMDGSETGLGVNLAESSGDVLIMMEGGGACFNTFTCSSVAHQNGFDGATLAQVVGEVGSRGIFNRDDDDNPFRNFHFIFVPYCTGDIFAGAAPSGFGGRVQVGYENVTKYLEVLVPGFRNSSRVVLSGISAGGFGALYNYHRVAQAFGTIPVTLLDDSGPPLSDTYLNPCLQQTLRDLWNLDATIPPDCTACTTPGGGGLGNVPGFLADAHPDRRLGLTTSMRDGTIRLFFGFGYPSCAAPQIPMAEATFSAGIAELRDVTLAAHPNFRMYTVESANHTWLLESPIGSTTSGGVKLTDWLRALLGEGSFDTVAP